MSERPDYPNMTDRALQERTAQRLDDLIDMRCEPAEKQRSLLFSRLRDVEQIIAKWAGKVAGISFMVAAFVTMLGLLINFMSCGG